MTIEEFKSADLRIGKVLKAERIDGSEKLIKLMVDVGEEQPRQILAGIRKWYEPEILVGRTIIVAANLEPKTFMGLESQGMLLAAPARNASQSEAGGDGEKPIPLTTLEEVEPGAKIR
mgnify:CR=1 FL=1